MLDQFRKACVQIAVCPRPPTSCCIKQGCGHIIAMAALPVLLHSIKARQPAGRFCVTLFVVFARVVEQVVLIRQATNLKGGFGFICNIISINLAALTCRLSAVLRNVGSELRPTLTSPLYMKSSRDRISEYRTSFRYMMGCG